MPEQSEANNHTSKINVFPVLHTIFYGANKSTFWPASKKILFVILYYE